jgi:two-component system LytT family response regulator
MNCIAIDDEPLALDVIGEFCKGINFLNLKGTFTNPFDAVEILNSQNIDLVFLDIHMPQITGIDFLRTLCHQPMVIFTTAYKEYAPLGFEIDAVDYLVKPFALDRFVKSVNKADMFLKLNILQNNICKNSVGVSSDFLMIKIEYNTKRVDLDDILFIEGMKDYVKIYTGTKPLLTKTTLKNIYDKLPTDRFLRVHKSYIVSLSKIDTIENNRIRIGEHRIPVGELFKTSFYSIVNRNLV